jgi:uncharacterized membrane protein YccC
LQCIKVQQPLERRIQELEQSLKQADLNNQLLRQSLSLHQSIQTAGQTRGPLSQSMTSIPHGGAHPSEHGRSVSFRAESPSSLEEQSTHNKIIVVQD